MASEVRLAAGDLDRGMEQLRLVIDAHRRSGGLGFASTSLGLYAALFAEQGDDAGAAHAIAEAATLTSPYDALSVVCIDCVRAVLAARSGDDERARSLGEQARERIAPTDVLVVPGDIHRWLAEVPARRGDVAEQRLLLVEAVDSYREKEHLPAVARAELALAALGFG